MTTPLAGTRYATLRHARHLRMCWQECRPVVQLMFALRFVTMLVIAATPGPGAGGSAIAVGWLVLAAAGWALATVAVYLLNGICDAPGDRVNGLDRPIATGALPEAAAWPVVMLCAAGSLLIAAVLPHPTVLPTLGFLVLGTLYSWPFHPLKSSAVGIVCVGVLAGLLTYGAAWQTVGDGGHRGFAVVFGFVLSGWIGIAGSTKDLQHVEGDRLAGRRTLPVVLGERRAARLLGAGAMLLSLAGLIVSLTIEPLFCAPAILLLVGGTILLGSTLSPRAVTFSGYRIFMVTQYAVHCAVIGMFLLSVSGGLQFG